MTIAHYVFQFIVTQLIRLGKPPVAARPSRAKR
jgi:hypothetical protein